MKKLSLNEAKALVTLKKAPAVSIYLKTNVRGPHSQRTLTDNLRRLYQSVEGTVRRQYGEGPAHKLLTNLKKTLRAIRPNRSRGGIAVFHREGFTGVLHIPTPVKDLAIAADSFHLKPVLRASQLRRSFYLLAFDARSVDFYKVTADRMTQLESMSFTGRYAQGTVGFSPPYPNLRIRRKGDLAESLNELNRQLDIHFAVERLPLLLAGPLYHQNLFRGITSYPYLLENGMNGDVSKHDRENLAHVSSLYMEQYFTAFDDHALRTFEQAEMTGLTSSRLEHIAREVVQGNVRHLFIAEDRHIWGHFDRGNGDLKLVTEKNREGTDDILDDLAEVTLLKKGEATVLPSILMPDAQPVAAILKGPSLGRARLQNFPSYVSLPVMSPAMRIPA